MNGKDIFLGMRYINMEYIEEAEFATFSSQAIQESRREETARRRKSLRRPILIAAVIALTLLLVGCGVIYVLKMQDLKLGDQEVTQERWDDENKTMNYETVSQQVLTFSGLKGTPNYEAAKEWYEFKKTYDPEWKIYHEHKDAGTLDYGPAEYSLYNTYTQEMRDKVDEITAKYGLKLRGKMVDAFSADALYAYLCMDGVLLPDAKAKTDDFTASFYDGGWFRTDMQMVLTDNPDWPYKFLCSLYYNPKDCFDTTVCELNDTADWQEWNYTTASGDNVLVIRSPSVWFSWVFCDRGDAAITLRIETIREVYTDEHGYEEVIQTPMTDGQLKEVLDCINFNIKPQPGDASLLEGPTASKELSLTQNGYTVTVKDVFTDGHTTKIHLGIAAPEDVDLEQYLNMESSGVHFYDVAFRSSEDKSHGGGMNYGFVPDQDGKANTLGYEISITNYVEEGSAFPKGSVWNLYLANMRIQVWNKELTQYDIIWEQGDTWNFEIPLTNGDWTELEFVSQPITTNVCIGWDMDGNDLFRDETITSLKLRTFGGDYASSSAVGQLDFANYKKEQYPKVVLKDGREIKLNGLLELYDSWVDTIPMSEVESLKLIDGTVLYPVNTVTPTSNPKQTQSGYTLELKSAVTDGRTARIILGVTAPEGTVLSRKDGIYDMFGAEFGNFGNHSVLQASDGRSWRDYGGGMETMRGLEDGDGRENTVDILYITEMMLPNEGISEIYFDPNLTWTLHIEGVTMDRSEYPEKILTQTVPLFSNEDTWDLTFTFDKDTDTREIEFLTKPKTIKAKTVGSGDSLRDLTMESFRVSALQLRIDWKDDIAGELFDYVSESYKIVTAVMKDGTRVPFDGEGDYTIPDYMDPIDLNQVDYVELIDGTRIYPAE